MNELEEKFYETGVVPVVVLEDAEDAVPLAQALVEVLQEVPLSI